MNIRELFEQASQNEYVDLLALIMFLVFEKKILTTEDSTKDLDIYFLEKHNKRMNRELYAYKNKMNINYGMRVFKVTSVERAVYISAHTEKQARCLASESLISVNDIKICDLDKLMNFNNKDMTFRTMINGNEPCVLGEY